MILSILIQVVFVFFNILMAKYDADKIRKNIREGKTDKLNHIIRSIIYCIPAAVAMIISVWLFFSLILIRVFVFNPALNAYRRLPFFYVGKGSGASVLDRLWGTKYPWVFACSIFLFIIIEIIIL